ncbi:MAG TPA: cytochrome c [Bryocella sp.]|nr:cytochrome c [Bryocella sp.]
MKRFVTTLAALAVFSCLGWAEDGATIYKTKCAACHGAAGEGKIGPSLQKTSLSEKQIADLVANGAAGKKAPHTKAVGGLSAEQAGAVATYVASLKK